jgi:hypothetical protein
LGPANALIPRYATRDCDSPSPALGNPSKHYRWGLNEKGNPSAIAYVRSRLKEAERALQHSFMKSAVFTLVSSLMVSSASADPRAGRHTAAVDLQLRWKPTCALPPAEHPLQLVGAWSEDEDLPGGLSGSPSIAAFSRSAIGSSRPPIFHSPQSRPCGWADLRIGPDGGRNGGATPNRWRATHGRGWWVAMSKFIHCGSSMTPTSTGPGQRRSPPDDWPDNYGAEGFLRAIIGGGREWPRASRVLPRASSD